jgi:tetratricopeptide (TPR) repeat protein
VLVTRQLVVQCAAIAICLAAAPAAAEQSSAKRSVARRHLELGQSLYKTSNYPAALEEFRRAYALEPHPDLLFNVARCLEVMGRLDEAAAAYREYLARKPDASDRDLVQTRIATLEGRARGERGGSWRRRVGWSAVGLGAASLVAGAVFSAMARSKADDYRQAADERRPYDELEEIARGGRAYQAAQIATLVAGGAIAAAGVVLLVLDRRGRAHEARAAAVRLVPFVAAGGAGVGGSF